MESLIDLKLEIAALERKRDFYHYYGQHDEAEHVEVQLSYLYSLMTKAA